jgi:hypothetical protein
VPALYKQGVISKNMFSWALENEKHASYLDLGPPDTSAMSDSNAIVWLPILNDYYWGYFWADYLSAFTLSNTSQVWSFNPTPAITDSGSSCLVGPKADITILERQVLKEVTVDFVDKSWGNVFSCSYLN